TREKRWTMKRRLSILLGAFLTCAVVAPAMAKSTPSATLKPNSIERAWRTQIQSLGTARSANFKLKGDARRAYHQPDRAWQGEGAIVVKIRNPTGRKDTVAAKTFAVFMHAGVGDHVRIFDRKTQKLIMTGDAVDGPMHWVAK